MHTAKIEFGRQVKVCNRGIHVISIKWSFYDLNVQMSRTAIPVLKAFSWAFCITCPCLTIVAMHNCSSRRKREVNLYFCFPFEFHRFCKTWQLYGIIEIVFCMSSECAHQTNSSKKLLKLFFLRNPSSSLWR